MIEQGVAREGHRSRGQRPFSYAVAALVLLAATGCSENPAPEPLEPDTSAASSTPTPTPSPSGAPTLPPEARGTTDKAAIAFVDHVIDVLNYSAEALDGRALQKLSESNCDACDAILDTIRTIRSDGGTISGGAWTPLETNVLAGGSPTFLQMQAVVRCASQTVVRAHGEKPIEHPAGRKVYIFDLRHGAAGWKVAAIRGGAS